MRAAAAARGLPVADKPDSQEICFAPRGTHADFVESRESAQPIRRGLIVGADGAVLGEHRGIHRFTIGQRRGLGIAAPQPLYVTAIDSDSGEVRVGSAADLTAPGLVATAATWLAEPPAVGARLEVKIRSRFDPQPCEIVELSDSSFALRSAHLRAVAAGQAAVLYDGERVLGGGWIEAGVAPLAAPRERVA